MKNFFEKPTEKLFNLKELDKEALLYRVMPRLLMEIARKYFRLEVEGVENLPKRGKGIVIPNHSGYSGFDAMLLGHEILKATDRIPRVLTHHLWFMTSATAIPAQKMGFLEATMNNGLEQLQKNKMIILFPEGEYGNFKPSTKAYQLQEFKRGFVRMAIMTQAPIIPAIVLGAEETHINLRQLKFSKYLMGGVLPLPLNILPLPARWKIKFLEPITLPYRPSAVNDTELVHEIAQDFRDLMQKAITEEIEKREWVYVRGVL